MKIWKRNAIVATVLLFVCAGIYLNWSVNQKGKGSDAVDLAQTLDESQLLGDTTLVMSGDAEPAVQAANEGLTTDVSTEEYFADVRLSRQEARDDAVTLLQETMAYTDDTTSESYSQTSAQLGTLVETALAEAQIESLIIAKGYADCVAYMGDDTISIAVAAPAEGLQAADVALISDVVTTESDYDMTQIRIIEVK